MGFDWYYFANGDHYRRRVAVSLSPNRSATPSVITPGSTVDISRYGAGLQLVPAGRAATLTDESGVLVATGTTEIDDATVFALLDAGRR